MGPVSSASISQDESTPIRPVNPYGAAKALAHVATHVYRQRDLHAGEDDGVFKGNQEKSWHERIIAQ